MYIPTYSPLISVTEPIHLDEGKEAVIQGKGFWHHHLLTISGTTVLFLNGIYYNQRNRREREYPFRSHS